MGPTSKSTLTKASVNDMFSQRPDTLIGYQPLVHERSPPLRALKVALCLEKICDPPILISSLRHVPRWWHIEAYLWYQTVFFCLPYTKYCVLLERHYSIQWPINRVRASRWVNELNDCFCMVRQDRYLALAILTSFWIGAFDSLTFLYSRDPLASL